MPIGSAASFDSRVSIGLNDHFLQKIMPTRHAILIGTPKLEDHENLPGVTADLENYSIFLKSNYGGAWEENEVQVMNTPDKSDIQKALLVT